MSYRKDYCLEVSDPSDWSLIGFEDAELVVFKHLFGNDFCDAIKANTMVSAMDNVFQNAKYSTGYSTIDVVIVSNSKMLEQCRRNHEHDILDDAIPICPGTTEKEPIDLTCDMSQYFILDHKFKYTNGIILQQAKIKIKDNGVLVICGPRGSGKSTLAITVLKRYPVENCLILTEPDDIKYIRPAETAAVLVEDMAGYGQFDRSEADKWFRKFNLLNAAVRSGGLKILITMQKAVYDRWSKCMPKHPLLDSCVFLLDTDAVQLNIKQEPMDVHGETATDASMPEKGVSTVRPDTLHVPRLVTPAVTSRNSWSVKKEQTFTVRLPTDHLQCQPSAICTVPSGETLLADQLNNNIKKLNERYEVVSKCNLPSTPLGLCYIGDNVAVISMITVLQFLHVTGNITLTKSVETNHSCFSIAGNSKKLYVADFGKVHVYRTDGSHEQVIFTGASSPISGLALSNDGSTLYVSKRQAITKFEWSGLLTMDTKGQISSSLQVNNCDGVCTDRDGNILVLCANGIVLVSSDGKCILDLLIDNDTLGEAICFCKNSPSLIASHSAGNSITVFELTDNTS